MCVHQVSPTTSRAWQHSLPSINQCDINDRDTTPTVWLVSGHFCHSPSEECSIRCESRLENTNRHSIRHDEHTHTRTGCLTRVPVHLSSCWLNQLCLAILSDHPQGESKACGGVFVLCLISLAIAMPTRQHDVHVTTCKSE